MLKKMSDWSLASYTYCKSAVVSFIEGLKDDERGVSGVVVAVILVLIAVLLAAFFWEKIYKFVTDMWGKVDENKDKFKTS